MNRLFFLSLLLGGSLVSCSGGDTPADDDAIEVISEADADAAAEAAINTEDDAKSAMDKLSKELDG